MIDTSPGDNTAHVWPAYDPEDFSQWTVLEELAEARVLGPFCFLVLNAD